MAAVLALAAPPGCMTGPVPADAGHGGSIAVLPLGVGAAVDADALTLTVDEAALLAG